MSQSLKILSLLLSILIVSGCTSEKDEPIFEPSKNSTNIEYFDNNTKFVITTNIESISGKSGIISVQHYIQGDNNSTEFIKQSSLQTGKMSLSCVKNIQTGTYIDYNCILYSTASYAKDINSTLRLYDNTTYTIYRQESGIFDHIITADKVKR